MRATIGVALLATVCTAGLLACAQTDRQEGMKPCCQKKDKITAKVPKCCKPMLMAGAELSACCKAHAKGDAKPCCTKTLELRKQLPACCQSKVAGQELDCCKKAQ